MKIELIFDRECPNVEATRSVLQEAFKRTNFKGEWQEWDRNQPDSPSYALGYGSPTILINGRDIAEDNATSEGNCCRIYSGGDGSLQGVPSTSQVIFAIRRAREDEKMDEGKSSGRWSRVLAVLPAVGAVLIPGLTCPACWPAYAGLLSSLGIGFFNYSPYLIPGTCLLVLLALISFAHEAKQRNGYGPLVLGIIAGILILSGRFVLSSHMATYLGITMLIFASIWNLLPKKRFNCCDAKMGHCD